MLVLLVLLFALLQDHPMTALAYVVAPDTVAGRNYIEAAVPVPLDWVETDLHLVDSGGTAWPTQQSNTVTNKDSKAMVVHLVAAVDCTSGVNIFSVEEGEEDSVENFPAQISVTLNAEDHANVLHTATLLTPNPAAIPAGNVKHRIQVKGRLNDGGTSNSLGYTAYISTYAGLAGVYQFDMSMQNATVNETPLEHHQFYRRIYLTIPAGHTVVHLMASPHTSTTSLVTEIGNGQKHVMLQGDLTHFRFAVCTTAQAVAARDLIERRGMAVCKSSRSDWSWSNPNTAFFTPMNVMIPDVNIPNYRAFGASWASIKSAIQTGAALPAANMLGGLGPYYPIGNTYGGVTSGFRVTAYAGLEIVCQGSKGQAIAREALLTYLAVMRMDCNRMAGMIGNDEAGFAMVEPDQTPINADDFALGSVKVTSVGQHNKNYDGPFPRVDASDADYVAVAAAGELPWYYNNRLAFSPYDFEHQIRGLGPAVACAWLADDPLAKDVIQHYAYWDRVRTLEYGSFGALVNSVAFANANNNKGGVGGREVGWSGYGVLADWFLQPSKRAGAATWLSDYVNLRNLAQLPSGFWMTTDGKPAEYLSQAQGGPLLQVSQAVEVGIDANFVRATEVASGTPTFGSGSGNIYRKMAAGCWNYHWPQGKSGPWRIMAVGDLDIVAGDAYSLVSQIDPLAFLLDGDVDNYQTAVIALFALMDNTAPPAPWQMLYAMTGTTTPYDALVALQTEVEENDTDTEGVMNKFAAGRGPLIAWLQAYLLPASASDPTIGGTTPNITTPPEDIITRIQAAVAGLSPRDQASLVARIRTALDRIATQ